MRKAIDFLRAHASERLDMAAAARSVGMSPSRFNHAFAEWVGISPKRFLGYLNSRRAQDVLADTKNLLSASHKLGLSGPGRLHGLLVAYEALSPGEFKSGNISLRYGIHQSPFGWCLIATSARGIAKVSFLESGLEREALRSLRDAWPKGSFLRDDAATLRYAKAIFSTVRRKSLRLALSGTNFQIKVWEALLSIPEGQAASYADIARVVGSPNAVRAVGAACGKNPIAFLIPCHRVLTSGGGLGGYKWGTSRKAAMLAWEAARTRSL
jgi:AraC family transcriptional regulator, regulatory protein of adaptative response / methylated-DNA-[protein]-cysteine methyltransferase